MNKKIMETYLIMLNQVLSAIHNRDVSDREKLDFVDFVISRIIKYIEKEIKQ